MVKQSTRRLDVIFAALADPIRRGMLERLSRGEATAGELARPHNVSLPAISRHLRVLENAGLLARRKTGRIHRCRLNPRPIEDAAQWIAQYRRFWEQQFNALAKFLEENEKEESPTWQHPASALKPRSKSKGPSKRPGKKSSGPGPIRSS
jgi:DNA-binding transcriptional ArsR family regulator